MQSQSTRRPSASVLLTSIVVPVIAVTMSPGFIARPLTRVLGGADDGQHADGQLQRGDRLSAPSTAAPPDMSNFISCMPAAGLIE